MDSDKIGSFIKSLRTKNNMSQKDLADRIPINREAVSKWECGRTIPDSSTIMRLSDIFDVSADEIMYGEYKTINNEKELNDIHLQIFDDRNTKNKKLKKTSKFLLVTFLLLIITIVVFLVYYFFNSYDSVKIYTIESKQDDIYLTDGTIMLTGENIYFRLGNINGIDENKISRIILYYDNDGDKNIIYEGSSPKDRLIRDYYGYNEYFEIKNKDVVFESLYVDIYYDNKVKTLNLTIKEEYSNKRLFSRKKEQSAIEEAEEIKSLDKELVNTIKEKLKNKDSGIYYQKMKIDNNIYDVYYIEDTSTILITWKKEKYTYSLDYYLQYENAYYSKSDNDLNHIDECSYDKSNPSKTTCDNTIINTLNSIINEITKGRS